MSVLFIDFETKSAVDIKKCGADVYARDPSTEILCLGYAFDDEPVRFWYPGCGIDAELDLHEQVFTHVSMGEIAVAHNAAFEIAIWNFVGSRIGFPHLDLSQVRCTMAMSYALALPGALADAAPAAGLALNKDAVGHRIMMQLSQPRSVDDRGRPTWWTKEDVPEKFHALYAYCMQDIEVERQLWKRILKLPPLEQELWVLDQKINQRGVQVDLHAVRVAIEIVEAEKKRLNEDMRKVTCEAVVTTTASGQLTDWLVSRGVKAESVAKSEVVALLERDDLPEDVRSALLIRQEAAKSSTAKLDAMLRGVCRDGRLRGMFQYWGAGATGRFAGRRVQLQNLKRPSLPQKNIDQVFNLLEAVK